MSEHTTENHLPPNGPTSSGQPGSTADAASGAHAPVLDRVGPAPAPTPWPQAPAQVAPTGETPASPAGTASPARGATDAVARDLKGRIHIADEVVEKVAGLAATEVEGVAALGGDIERAIESVRERIGIGNKRGDQGIKADVKGDEVTISVTIMVEFGHVVLDVARRVQANVARQTERMLGLRVVEVNVTVDDVRTAPKAE